MSTKTMQAFVGATGDRGEISLSIDRIFPLEQAAEAHRYMESNQSKGKIVLEI